MAGRRRQLAITIAGPGDVATIAELRALWSTGAGADEAFTARIGAWLAAEGERRSTWIGWSRQQAVGMASMWEYRRMPHPDHPDSRWGYISNMFVRPEDRDTGVGTALLRELISTARERGYLRLVLSPSERAIPFYRRAGFVEPTETGGAARLLVHVIQR